MTTDVRRQLAMLGRPPTSVDIAEALRASGQIVTDQAVLSIQSTMATDSQGIGILQPLLDIPGITDILVNGPREVFIDRGEGVEQVAIEFPDDEAVRRLGVRLAASAGRRLDDGSPYVDARLSNGLRFHAVLAGIADPGTCLSFRIPAKRALSLTDWQAGGGLEPGMAAVLKAVVDTKRAFIVSGGTGSGKTTLLASMLSRVPVHDRLVIVEDSRELDPDHPHVVRLESRPRNMEGAGQVTMIDLVRQALRMRPDRLVVGEVRGAEIRELLQALNTGHEGGCGTIHANSIGDLPARLEALALLGGLGREAAHAQIASAFDVAIHVERVGGLRRVSQVGVFQASASGLVDVVPAVGVTSEGVRRMGGADRLEELLS